MSGSSENIASNNVGGTVVKLPLSTYAPGSDSNPSDTAATAPAGTDNVEGESKETGRDKAVRQSAGGDDGNGSGDDKKFKREERMREILLEARKSRVRWILGEDDADDSKSDLWNGSQNPIEKLQACSNDVLPCAPAVIEALFSSSVHGCSDNGSHTLAIASELKRVLERQQLSWKSVSSSPKGATPPRQHDQPEILGVPPVPLPKFYHLFLQILCQPPAADLVLSMQKFCKTVEQAAEVMVSVREEESRKHQERIQKQAKEQLNLSLQHHQHPLAQTSKKSTGDILLAGPNAEKGADKAKNQVNSLKGDNFALTSHSSKPELNSDPADRSNNVPVGPSSSISSTTTPSSTPPQVRNHGGNLAKALRGFINSTMREMETHPAFQNYPSPDGDSKGSNLGQLGSNSAIADIPSSSSNDEEKHVAESFAQINSNETKPGMSANVREQLMASLEKFVYSKCGHSIRMVLAGDFDFSEDDDPPPPFHGQHNIQGGTQHSNNVGKTIGTLDQELHKKMLSLQFVTPDHLDIDCLKDKDNANTENRKLEDIIDLSLPIQQLRSIHEQSSPRQMLQTILLAHRGICFALSSVGESKGMHDHEQNVNDGNGSNTAKYESQTNSKDKMGEAKPDSSDDSTSPRVSINERNSLNGVPNNLLSPPPPPQPQGTTSQESQETIPHRRNLPGADDILPTLILTVLKAHPTHLLSDIRFIEHFASASLLRGEAGYAYTNLCGAIQFLRRLDIEGHMAEVSLGEGAVLSITPEEFRAGLEQCRKAMGVEESILSEGNREKMGKGMREVGWADSMGSSEELTSNDTSNKFDNIERGHLQIKISAREIREARANGDTVDFDWALQKQNDFLRRTNGVKTAMNELNVNDHFKVSSPPPHPGEAEIDVSLRHSLPPEEPPLPPNFSRSYSFLAASPDDIRLSDLTRLLDEYRMLVHVTEILLNERSEWREAEKKRQILLTKMSLEKDYESLINDGVSGKKSV